jgi:dTDP-4-amino-4,6-dideoxygalactose transaminase
MLEAREALAGRYGSMLARASAEGSAFSLPGTVGPRAWYRYSVELHSTTARACRAKMHAAGVMAEIPVTDWRPSPKAAPVADRAFERLISLPLYPTLTPSEQDRVVEVFLSSIRQG